MWNILPNFEGLIPFMNIAKNLLQIKSQKNIISIINVVAEITSIALFAHFTFRNWKIFVTINVVMMIFLTIGESFDTFLLVLQVVMNLLY